MGETYASSGVSLDAADEVVGRIGPLARSTFRPEVLSDIGGFGAMFALGSRFRDPVLVSSTDGVGTKLDVARATRRFRTIGIDLVAMCVDDVVVQGAEPLFLLDYVGVGRLDPSVVEQVVEGIALGCRTAGCALIGGEVAEHPGGDPDAIELAGFVVGAVERDGIVTGGSIEAGHVLVGIASPGLRSNGYSLARRVLLERAGLPLDGPAWPRADVSLADELLRPSVIYAPAVLSLLASVEVHGIVHVTGGGLPGNVPRVLPDGCSAVVRRGSWPVPHLFEEIARLGAVAPEEMARTFNLGIGMVVVVGGGDVGATIEHLHGAGHDAWEIGEVVAGDRTLTYAG